MKIVDFRLPLLEAAITETYRINPIAPQTPHHSTLCDAKLRGYDIPKVKLKKKAWK